MGSASWSVEFKLLQKELDEGGYDVAAEWPPRRYGCDEHLAIRCRGPLLAEVLHKQLAGILGQRQAAAFARFALSDV
jgi:hypothetical protein